MSATSTDPELPTRASEDLRYFVVPISVTLDTIAWRPESLPEFAPHREFEFSVTYHPVVASIDAPDGSPRSTDEGSQARIDSSRHGGQK